MYNYVHLCSKCLFKSNETYIFIKVEIVGDDMHVIVHLRVVFYHHTYNVPHTSREDQQRNVVFMEIVKQVGTSISEVKQVWI